MENNNIKKNFKGEGGYVFISHSHKDIKVVREIRNLFEENGFEPILFYLKCMDQELTDSSEVLRDLIYKEIDARSLFLYVDSSNARASKWVQEEILHAKKDVEKRIEIINLDDIAQEDSNNNHQLDEIKYKITNILKSSEIYIICNSSDKKIFDNICNFLINKDYRVFNPYNEILCGMEFPQTTSSKIEEAANNGIIIYIVNRKSLESSFCIAEFNEAKRLNAKMIFVLIDEVYDKNSGCVDFNDAPIIKYEENEEFYNLLLKTIQRLKY